jgi:hypothetical protein
MPTNTLGTLGHLKLSAKLCTTISSEMVSKKSVSETINIKTYKFCFTKLKAVALKAQKKH